MKTKVPVWNGNLPELPERLSKRGKAELLGGAAVGRVEKPAKSLPGSHLPRGLAPRLKKNPMIFEGSEILNRGKTHKKVAFAKEELHHVVHQDVQQEVQEHQLSSSSSQVKTQAAGGGANLMGPLLSKGKGETLMVTRGGNLIPLAPKKKIDLEELERQMKTKLKWTCVRCVKFLPSEQAVQEHLKQAQISIVGRRMHFKPATCKLVTERVYTDEQIMKRIIDES